MSHFKPEESYELSLSRDESNEVHKTRLQIPSVKFSKEKGIGVLLNKH